MDIGQVANDIIAKAKQITINYTPNSASLERNKTKALFGAAALGGAYLIPGEHPILVVTALGYTALKCYQSVRDWANR